MWIEILTIELKKGFERVLTLKCLKLKLFLKCCPARCNTNATKRINTSEKYSSPNNIAMMTLSMMNKLPSERILYFFFNKLGIGSISLKLKMTSSFFNPSAAMYFFKLVYLRHEEAKY